MLHTTDRWCSTQQIHGASHIRPPSVALNRLLVLHKTHHSCYMQKTPGVALNRLLVWHKTHPSRCMQKTPGSALNSCTQQIPSVAHNRVLVWHSTDSWCCIKYTLVLRAKDSWSGTQHWCGSQQTPGVAHNRPLVLHAKDPWCCIQQKLWGCTQQASSAAHLIPQHWRQR